MYHCDLDPSMRHTLQLIDGDPDQITRDAEKRIRYQVRTDAEVQRHAEVGLHPGLVHETDEVVYRSQRCGVGRDVEGVALGGWSVE